MKTKNITANGEFVFIKPDSHKDISLYLIDFKYETVGLCSEIIKDEELAKRVVDSLPNVLSAIGLRDYRDYSRKFSLTSTRFVFVKATESFASLLQANDIDLEVGNWLVIKKV